MAEFHNTGPIWVVSLDEEETRQLAAGVGAGSAFAVAAGPFAPVVIGAIGAAVAYIIEIDKLGGRQGVDINGVVGTTGIIVTPRASGLYARLTQAATVAVNTPTIIEFVIKASGEVASVGGSLGFAAVGSTFLQVLAGTPLVAALAGALVFVGLGGFGHGDSLDDHGHVEANRDRADAWERFLLAHLGPENWVSLLSWRGLFSAQNGGGAGVYANRPQVGPWERWNLIDNNDGSVSFQSINGHYLCAEGGGDSYCVADRTAIGNWERFIIERQPDGHIALKTHDKGKYISVQP